MANGCNGEKFDEKESPTPKAKSRKNSEKDTSGYKYILVCIDVFSRYGRALPLKSKSAIDVSAAISTMIKTDKPRHLQTDEGKEFYNSKNKELLDKHQINHYSVYSQYKAAIVERFN